MSFAPLHHRSMQKTASSYSPRLSHPVGAPVKFSGSPLSTPGLARRVLENLDFTAVGASPVKQVGLVFSSLITWRLLAANERRRASVSKRWNELRENLLRDLLGFGFWFLGVPVLQRVYLSHAANRHPHMQDVLIRHEKETAQNTKGVMGWLKANNPLHNRYIPSSQQVKDQMHQALNTLKKAGIAPEHGAYQETKAIYQNLIKHRNFATALGLGSTILLLGVGINLLNFWLTKRNVSPASQPQNSVQIPPQARVNQSAGQPFPAAWPGVAIASPSAIPMPFATPSIQRLPVQANPFNRTPLPASYPSFPTHILN